MRSADYTKLTAEARTALVGAHEEARLLGHQEIGACHVLLGLVATPDSRVAQVLRESGMGLQSAREALTELAPRSSQSASSLDWAPELLVVLETATSEHDEVPATVLCAAVLSCDNTATDVMDILGMDRMVVLARLREGAGAQAARARNAPTLVCCVQQAIERAELLATSVGRAPDEGDVAVALLDDPDSPLARALAHLGIDRERLEEALADTRSVN